MADVFGGASMAAGALLLLAVVGGAMVMRGREAAERRRARAVLEASSSVAVELAATITAVVSLALLALAAATLLRLSPRPGVSPWEAFAVLGLLAAVPAFSAISILVGRPRRVLLLPGQCQIVRVMGLWRTCLQSSAIRSLQVGKRPDGTIAFLTFRCVDPHSNESVWLAATEGSPVEFELQLAAQGVPVEEAVALPGEFDWSPPISVFVVIAALVIALVLGNLLILLGSFWFHWIYYGTMNSLWSFVACLLLNLLATPPLFFWSPIPSRVRRLISWRWGAEGFPLSASNATAPRHFSSGTTCPATLEGSGEALLLKVGKETHLVARSETHDLRIGADRVGELSLLQRRSLQLDWVDARGLAHAAVFRVENGTSGQQEAHAADALHQALQRWREGDAFILPPALNAPRSVPLFTPVMGLLLALTAILLHNHLVWNPVRSGQFRPPLAEPTNRSNVRPLGTPIQGVAPARMLLMEPRDGTFALTRLWSFDAHSERFRFVAFTGAPPFAQGSPATHLLTTSDHLFALQLLPPTLLTGERTPRAVDLQGGLTHEVPLLELPEDSREIALHRDKFLAWANPRDMETGDGSSFAATITVHQDLQGFHRRDPMRVRRDQALPRREFVIRLVPLASPDAVRKLAVVNGYGENADPVFFPGGTHLLACQQVIKIDDGTVIPLQIPPGLPEDFPHHRRIDDVFPTGEENALGLRVCLTLGDRLVNQVWRVQIDGRVEVLRTFPPEEFLLSGDATRWLIGRFDAGAAAPTLWFEQRASQERKALFVGSLGGEFTLVHGQDRLLVSDSKGGFDVLDFMGQRALSQPPGE